MLKSFDPVSFFFYPVFLQVASFSGRYEWGLDDHPLFPMGPYPRLMLLVSDWPSFSLITASMTPANHYALCPGLTWGSCLL